MQKKFISFMHTCLLVHVDRLEQLYYQAKNDLGSEKLQLLKLLIFGPPGTGKSSLLKVLLGGDPDPVRNSTGVCDRHLVRCTIAVAGRGCNWMKIELADEIQRLRLKIEEKFTDESPALQDAVYHTKHHRLKVEDIFFRPDDSAEQYQATDQMPFDIKQTSSLIACYDSGGQPEFFDVMPAITTTPTGYVMVFDMSKDPSSQCAAIDYYRNGIRCSAESTVHYTNAELMKAALSNIQSCTNPVSDERVDLRLSTCGHLLVVGTHLDKCGSTKEEQDGKVLQVEKTMQRDILNLLVGSTVHIVQRHNQALIHPISNTVKADRDEIAREIRTAVESFTDDKDIPINWLLFQLEIRHTEKYYILKSRCIDIATKCYIKEEDVDSVLMYFHELGVLLHYRTIPELQHVVFCDPQWLFDKLTKLIEVKYDPLHVIKNKISSLELKHINPHSIIKRFKHGTFDKMFLCTLYSKDFSTNDVINYQHLSELFAYLNIMAALPGETDQYFMPALLDPAPANIDESLPHAFGRKIYDTLIVKFENKYVPRGVFCCLVVECVRNAIGWHVLHGDTAFRNLIMFQMLIDLDLYVCLRDKIDSITVEMYHKSKNTLLMNLNTLCYTLRKSLNKVCIQLKITDNFKLGFACQQYLCRGFTVVPHQLQSRTLSVCDQCNHRCLLQNDQLVFTLDELKQVCPQVDDVPGAINGFGLLQAVQYYPKKKVGSTLSFNFLHLTMQEFLAAEYISRCSVDQQKQLLKKLYLMYKHLPLIGNWLNLPIAQMWQMYLGIVGVNSPAWIQFTNEQGYSLDRFKVSPLWFLYYFQCLVEGNSKDIPETFPVFQRNQIRFSPGTVLLPYYIAQLCLLISKSSELYKYYVFHANYMSDSGMAVLETFLLDNKEKLNCIASIDLTSNNLTSHSKTAISNIIRGSKLVELKLANNNLGESGAMTICNAVKANPTIKNLNLSHNAIGISGAQILADLLSHNCSLEELSIGNNKITDVGAAALSDVLKSNRTLKSLDIAGDDLTETTGKKFAEIFDLNMVFNSLKINELCISVIKQNSSQCFYHGILGISQGWKFTVNSDGSTSAVEPYKHEQKDFTIQRMEVIRLDKGKTSGHLLS